MPPVHPYWPMLDGSKFTYTVNEITGVWVDRSMRIAISDSKPHANSPQVIVWERTRNPAFFGKTPLNMELVNGEAAMMEGRDRVGGIAYIGEAGNRAKQITTMPMLAKLPVKPIVGQEIKATSTVYRNANKSILQLLPWRQRTIAIGAWGGWSDTIRTGLREFNIVPGSDVLDHVYNYVFVKGIGLVHFWHGRLVGNVVTGYEYFMTEYAEGSKVG